MWLLDIRLSTLLVFVNAAIVALLLVDYLAIWRRWPRRLPFYLAVLLLIGGGVIIANAMLPRSGFYGQVYGEDNGIVQSNNVKQIALTFDDGPSPIYTPELLAILQRYRIPATFFLIGEKAELHAGLVRQIRDAGHEIGNHTWDHRDLLSLTRKEVWWEIDKTNNTLQAITGNKPSLLRPPHGFRDRTIIDMAGERHMRVVEWTVMARDWVNPGTEVIVERIVDNVTPGAIVLLHDGDGMAGISPRRQTVEAVKQIIPALLSQGYTFVRVSDIPWRLDNRQPQEVDDYSK